MNLDGRSVLLTGATGGIGKAIARALAARGARLVLTGRRADVLEPLAAEVGGRAVVCDLALPDEVTRLLSECSNADVLVANAALPASGLLGSFSVEEIDRALAVNLRAPIVLARALSAGMVARGHGHLVFVSSLSGKAASARGSIYSATKYGLRGFALGLREDLRDSGVGVSTVFPGFISDAGMFHESGARLPGYVAMKTPDASPRRSSRRSSATARRSTSRRSACGSAPRWRASLPELNGRVQRRLGSLDIAEAMAEGQKDKR